MAGSKHRFASDIWSVGCFVFELLTGRPPFIYKGDSGLDYLNGVVRERICDFSGRIDFPVGMSPTAREFIGACLKRNPGERANLSTLLNHPFVLSAQPNLDSLEIGDSSVKQGQRIWPSRPVGLLYSMDSVKSPVSVLNAGGTNWFEEQATKATLPPELPSFEEEGQVRLNPTVWGHQQAQQQTSKTSSCSPDENQESLSLSPSQAAEKVGQSSNPQKTVFLQNTTVTKGLQVPSPASLPKKPASAANDGEGHAVAMENSEKPLNHDYVRFGRSSTMGGQILSCKGQVPRDPFAKGCKPADRKQLPMPLILAASYEGDTLSKTLHPQEIARPELVRQQSTTLRQNSHKIPPVGALPTTRRP